MKTFGNRSLQQDSKNGLDSMWGWLCFVEKLIHFEDPVECFNSCGQVTTLSINCPLWSANSFHPSGLTNEYLNSYQVETIEIGSTYGFMAAGLSPFVQALLVPVWTPALRRTVPLKQHCYVAEPYLLRFYPSSIPWIGDTKYVHTYIS